METYYNVSELPNFFLVEISHTKLLQIIFKVQ